MYDYKCEYCDGVVKERIIKKEVFKHKNGFVMLEDVPVGICDECGYRYYHASILKIVEEIANGKRLPERTEVIPVAHLVNQ
ncbi:MAG: YgiT-type zinc finger protein [Planctomycetes bacterium]|nr:YgiT-type zinc finger protein [Planctomycetota bacterium]